MHLHITVVKFSNCSAECRQKTGFILLGFWPPSSKISGWKSVGRKRRCRLRAINRMCPFHNSPYLYYPADYQIWIIIQKRKENKRKEGDITDIQSTDELKQQLIKSDAIFSMTLMWLLTNGIKDFYHAFSCEQHLFQAHHVNSHTVTLNDLFCGTGLLKYSVSFCKI